MINYSLEKTKLTTQSNSLFDVKTSKTSFGKDLYMDSSGSISRIIGIDKLMQQTEKCILLKKGSYSTASTLGTNLVGRTTKEITFLNVDVRQSLSTYAKLQQEQKSIATISILGRNVYRTQIPEDSTSWKKLNSSILTKNTYEDTSIVANTTYYYAVTLLYKDIINTIKETEIKQFQAITTTNSSTLTAEVSDDFILLNKNTYNVLYWNLPTELSKEEQLRSIIDVIVSPLSSDPRYIKISTKLTNLDLTATQIDVLKGKI